jgi:AcrR family transcriptional regulator
MSARVRSRRGQGESLRDDILAAAQALLVETQSEDAVSIRAVADRVGVTPPSIYRHFEDKATLLFAVCMTEFDRLDVELRAALACHDDPVEAVIACGRAYVQFGLANPETYRIMFMGSSEWTPDQYRDELMADHAAFTGLVEAVGRASDAGRLRIADPMMAAVLLFQGVHGMVSLRIAKPNFPWPDVETHIDLTIATMGDALFLDAPE